MNKTNTPEPFYSLELNISTSSTYDSFGIIDKFRTKLSKSNINIGVTTLVYDSNGNRVGTASSHVGDFSQVTQSIETIQSGAYTVVTVVTMVDSGKNYQSNYWTLENLDKLSTATISGQRDAEVDEEGVIGLSVEKITVSGDTKLVVNPQAIGALVEARMENLNKSKFVSAGFFSKNKASGYKLNPDATGSNRYVVNNLDENVFTSRWRKSERYNSLNSIYSGYFYILEDEINWMFAALSQGTNYFCAGTDPEAKFELKAGTLYTAGAYYTDRAVEPFVGYLGTASGYTDWYSKVDKTPTSLFSMEPHLIWDGSVADVKAYMSSYSILSDVNQPGNGERYWMSYLGKDKESYYEYQFTSKTSGLKYVFQDFYSYMVTIDEVCNYLVNNGYSLVQYSEEDSVYTYYRGDTQAEVHIDRITDDDGVYKWDEFVVRYSQRSNLLFKEPYLKWGASVADVGSYMAGYQVYEAIPELVESWYRWSFKGKYNEYQTGYWFSSPTGGLKWVNVFFKPESVGEDEIVKELTNYGFTFDRTEGEDRYYKNANKNTEALYTLQDEGYWLVQYSPLSSNSRRKNSRFYLERVVTLEKGNTSAKKSNWMPSLNRIEQWKPVNVLKCN